MKPYRDTDYLQATARVRAKENGMVTGRDFAKMVDAKNAEEAFKVLSDAAICQGCSMGDYEAAFRNNLKETYELVASIAPDPEIVEIFRLKYDGHNLKTAVKGKKTGGAIENRLSPLGNVPAEELLRELAEGRFNRVPQAMGKAALEAAELLARTGDPQAVDILVDRAMLETMAKKAHDFGNPFLTSFVEAQVDIANIRTVIRLKRMGKDAMALKKILAEGGSISVRRLLELYPRGYDELLGYLSTTPYGKTLEPCYDAIRAERSLTLFEKLCDNHMVAMLDRARLIPFGIEPLVAYLYAKECETKAARIVLASKLAGVPSEQITERLRDVYA